MKFRKSLVAVGVLAVLASGQAMADLGSIGLYANTDNQGNNEGVFITSNGSAGFGGAASAVFLTSDGVANLKGSTSFNIYSPATSLSGALSVSGSSTTTGISNTGTLSNTGAFTQAGGVANININSTQTTNIGTGTGASINNIGGVTSTNTITGASNSVTASTGDNSILASAGNNSIAADQNNYLTAGRNNNITAATGINNIEAPINRIGVSTTSSVNTIGNTNANTSVTTRGGNATSVVANNRATLTVINGTSDLPGATDTTIGKLAVSNTGGASVDANGKITADNSTAPSASLTLTNGLGNTHGIVVTESQTTISGGTQSSSLTLNNRAATFSQSQSGAPITVTGVANGASDFDAVNVRQFAGAIAAVTAAANIPAPEAGKASSVGMGLGTFMGKTALSLGVVHQVQKGPILKFSVAGGLEEGGQTPTVGLGAGWSW